MNKEILSYLKNVNSRDNSNKKVQEIRSQLAELKRNALKEDNQKQAKAIWCFEQILKIQTNYLLAFQQLKLETFYDAWCTLEQCELAIAALTPHFHIGDNTYFLKFISDHVPKYQSIYPYKLFFSTELLEEEKICNICKQKISIRNNCGHKVGEIYNGEICVREITKSQFLGIASVESPVHKYSVPFLIDPKTKEVKDNYDYSLLQYLMQRLNSPLSSWDVEKTTSRHPHVKFKHYGRNDMCPCGSNKKYKKCCLKTSGVLRPHYEFIFPDSLPEELAEVKYNY